MYLSALSFPLFRPTVPDHIHDDEDYDDKPNDTTDSRSDGNSPTIDILISVIGEW